MVKKLLRLKQSAALSFCAALLALNTGAFGQELALSENRLNGAPAMQESEKTKPLSKALDELEERFNVHLNYEVEMVNEKFVDSAQKTSDFKDLDEALTKLLSPMSLKYERIEENYYVIYPAKSGSPASDNRFKRRAAKSVGSSEDMESSVEKAARMSASSLVIQDMIVRGKVTSMEDNQPLPGVNVIIKGTTTGTTTDIDGNYSLQVRDQNAVLIFSYIGYTTEEVNVAGRSVIDLSLVSDITELSEIVVVGYGEQKAIHLTGSVARVELAEIEDLPTGNLGASLAGRIPGLSISGGATRPGSTASLKIRNPESLAKDGGNNEPLYVIDDVIQIGADGRNDNTLFNSLDPAEVESISVLKDASAAVFGARGANGVLIVKTKRGKEGPPRINYSGSYAVNDEAYRTKMLSAYEFGMYYNIMNGPYGGARNAENRYFFSQDELDHFKTIDFDWLDMAWKPAHTMRHNINMTGGAERATYFASLSYFNQDGNLSTLDYDRWNFRAGTEVKVMENLKTGLQVSGNNGNKVQTFNKIGGENDENDYKNLLRAPRYIPPYIDGYAVKLPSQNDQLSRYHFFEIEKLGNLKKGKSETMTVNLFAEYEVPFVEGLKGRVSYGRNSGSQHNSQVGTVYTLYEFIGSGENEHIYDQGATIDRSRNWENGNRLYYSNINNTVYQLNFTGSYNRIFGKHNVSGLFTIEKSEAESGQQDVWKEQPISSTNGQFNTAFGELDGKTVAAESGSMSYIGRANYAYDNKYLAEFLFRSDASTKFSPENYWGKFYSGSVGWIISNENFFNVNGIDYLKFRYSTGLLGKDDTRAWQWRQRYTFQNGKGAVFGENNASSIGMKMEASPNPNATWSDEWKNNLGIDAEFLNNRLSTTLDVFYNKGTNMLIERTGIVPITVGGSIAAENWGEIDFFGYELILGWNDRINSDFRYGIDAHLSWYGNKVRQSNFNEEEIKYPWKPQPDQDKDNGVWGYDYLGMFRTPEEVEDYISKYNITSVFETEASDLVPGMLYYRDVRGPLQEDGTFAEPDGIIDENDQIQLAKYKSNPYGFGVTLKAAYKSLSFDCVISGSFGGWSEIDRATIRDDISRGYQSLPVLWNDVFDPDLNPEGTLPNPYWEDISLSPTSNFWSVSGFRMRMRNINVSYALPKKLTESLSIRSSRIIFTALNPLNFYNPFDYKDSEGSFDTYPVLRTYSLGVNVGF